MDLETVGKALSEKEQERLEFQQTLEKIEDKDFLERVLRSEEWSVFRKAWEQTRAHAQHKLNGIDPNNTNEIIRLQIMIDFYDNVLSRSISTYRELGRQALRIAREEGWLDRIAAVFTKE